MRQLSDLKDAIEKQAENKIASTVYTNASKSIKNKQFSSRCLQGYFTVWIEWDWFILDKLVDLLSIKAMTVILTVLAYRNNLYDFWGLDLMHYKNYKCIGIIICLLTSHALCTFLFPVQSLRDVLYQNFLQISHSASDLSDSKNKG